MTTIVVEDLYKTYRVHSRSPGVWSAARSLFHREHKLVHAVDGISFRIEAAERVGFLGPNGAGKTTTLKILSGLLYPTQGQVRVGEHIPTQRQEAFLKSIMLVMGQKQQLLWDLPPSETFELNRVIYHVDKVQFKKTLEELVSLLGLGDLIGKPTRQLSLGERMKCELAAALIHLPKVLFLDEPTIGLDVNMQSTIRDFIKHYNQVHGATVLLTSHYMEDVTALCERVIVIDHGKLSYNGSLEELSRQVRPEKQVVLHLREPAPLPLPEGLGKVVTHEPHKIILQVPQEAVAAVVTRALALLPVQDLNVESAPLQAIMSELFAKQGAALSRKPKEAPENAAVSSAPDTPV